MRSSHSGVARDDHESRTRQGRTFSPSTSRRAVVVAIQTKTTETATQGWILGAKDETPTDRADAWYVFGRDERASSSARSSTSCLATTVSAHLFVGPPALASDTRQGRQGASGQRDAQHLPGGGAGVQGGLAALLAPTTGAPYALPDWVAIYAAELGLPPGHPTRLCSPRRRRPFRRRSRARSLLRPGAGVRVPVPFDCDSRYDAHAGRSRRSVSLRKAGRTACSSVAGASITSGIPSAESCIWEWKRQIFITKNVGLEPQFRDTSLPSGA